MDSRRVITTQTSLIPSKTARIQLVSMDTHVNVQRTRNSMLFLRVDAFLSSKVGIVQQAACTSQLFAESILRGGLK
jgi:hypothetical protein